MLGNYKKDIRNHAILLISCPDQRGITARITNFLYENQGNIVHADQHIDEQSNTFFMRIEWALDGFQIGNELIAEKFEPIARAYKMNWQIHFTQYMPRVAVFVSRHLHCLIDLLFRQMAGHFACEIPLIISNHSYAHAIAEEFGIAFHETPITPETKTEQEQKQMELLKDQHIDLIVLARYHQILTPKFCSVFESQMINIHHSFLPAFAGANPYAQAYAKGVKIIGATSHYVTENLDEGPIISQETVSVTHRDTLDDLVRKGEDLEKQVLSRALRLALEHKILRYGNKTVVFE